MEKLTTTYKKFQHPDITATGATRGRVSPTNLKTLWINTGTLCNLECANCYIESSPKNDSLVYISLKEVSDYLDEIKEHAYTTKQIAFTGGEPFMNPEMIDILKLSLERGFECLVLTNAMKPMEKKQEQLLELRNKYNTQLKLRVSLDHYSEALHSKERGPRAWAPALRGLIWISENDFSLSVAGRILSDESEEQIRSGFKKLFEELNIGINSDDQNQLVLFPEMTDKAAPPEITTACWDILDKNPSDIMCATSRMVVKKRGEQRPTVVACTLLPYDKKFDLGHSLKNSLKDIKLNHPYCAQFCVLGGGSCSS